MDAVGTRGDISTTASHWTADGSPAAHGQSVTSTVARNRGASASASAPDIANAGENSSRGGDASRVDRDGAGEAGDHQSETAATRTLRKWRRMLGITVAEWKCYVRAKPQVAQRRVHRGIPGSLRGYAWQVMSGGRELRVRNPEVYDQP